jgi:hypothetical protein
MLGSLVFCAVFFGGLVLIAAAAIQGRFLWFTTVLLAGIFVLGAAKSWVRLRAVGIALEAYRSELNRSLPAHLLLWPCASVLYLVNAIAAAFSQRIEWRGITYELKSPTEAVIIRPKTRN